MLALLVFFGIFVDMIQTMLEETALGSILAAVEDGGEMVVMSIIAWFVFNLNFENKELGGLK